MTQVLTGAQWGKRRVRRKVQPAAFLQIIVTADAWAISLMGEDSFKIQEPVSQIRSSKVCYSGRK